ncbi:hypothetical protein HanIR_Chr01g0049481 [Helianthus annuus]|nr:hypothetical protein HanIR_Chr01g0049481 [Helianthus annuus]
MDFSKPEVAFRELGVQLFIAKEFENKTQVLFMLLLTFRVDQDVVNKHNHEFVEVRLAHSVHEIHEDRRRVSHSKGHDEEFVMTITSSECSFGDVLVTDSQLMIA